MKKDDGNAGVANNTYGTLSTLQVRQGTIAYRSYLKFQVSGLAGTVTAAKLRLAVSDDSADGGRVYRVGDLTSSGAPWSDANLTWNNAPPLGTQVGNAGAVPVGSVTITLDPSVFTGDGTYSFALASASTNSAVYSSREGANPPQLILTTS